ncbi:hypothetical protein KOW79_010927 [Hemibagrus wyckioides]|uniref:Uncharacterized protein n=1 Tax=Hemibagrus wyckioides TaxID=337641 RepID=A0A9D3SJ50_9TELE|nr:uncharacterized protein LOC131362483 isoform X2 [Hemibagrus wyckioides]KAG7326002.1 hypothetical protein KOW79_010927 [Hemibagrus wyckioides]
MTEPTVNTTTALKNSSYTTVNTTTALKNSSYTTASRPDWLLYVVPSIAFVFGLWLFSKIYRRQRRREQALLQVAALKKVMNTTSTGQHTYTSQRPTKAEKKDSSRLQNSSETPGNLKKQEAQSYENVTAVIYSNEDKINYCVHQDDDYITPDADTDEVTETEKSIYLQPLQNFLDTDGESYENMEGSVYAHPRQPIKKNALSVEDDDYINPDGENKHNLEHTDTESYENMAGLACPNTNTQTVDEGCYECMDRKQIQS